PQPPETTSAPEYGPERARYTGAHEEPLVFVECADVAGECARSPVRRQRAPGGGGVGGDRDDGGPGALPGQRGGDAGRATADGGTTRPGGGEWHGDWVDPRWRTARPRSRGLCGLGRAGGGLA